MISASYAASVIAVPPLAREEDGSVSREENIRLIRHMEEGDVSLLLYGGNADFYHMRPSEYGGVLALLAEAAGPETEIIPAAGPSYGLMMDHADALREHDFNTALVLPYSGLLTPEGVATGLRKFAERFGKPVVVQLKSEDYLTPDLLAALVKDGVVEWIKYAVIREDPACDPLLEELTELIDPGMILSGLGEQRALTHMGKFDLGGYTSGCACVAPALSQKMLALARAGEWDAANMVRRRFAELEELRDTINPVRVLHEAVTLSGLARMGEIPPLLSGLAPEDRVTVQAAVCALLADEREARAIIPS